MVLMRAGITLDTLQSSQQRSSAVPRGAQALPWPSSAQLQSAQIVDMALVFFQVR
jgi:hypothetical protein